MASDTFLARLDGITPLPAGHVATIKSYLERPGGTISPAASLPVQLHRLRGKDAARYRALFRTIGLRWLWWSRLQMTSGELAAILDHPATEAFAVVAGDEDIGLLEWDFTQTKQPELAFLGLIETSIGRGLGSALMARTLNRMADAERVRVNTCTFDHPGALAFYRKWGFSVVAQAVEIVPDPRLSGLLPEHAAPHIPLLAISASCS